MVLQLILSAASMIPPSVRDIRLFSLGLFFLQAGLLFLFSAFPSQEFFWLCSLLFFQWLSAAALLMSQPDKRSLHRLVQKLMDERDAQAQVLSHQLKQAAVLQSLGYFCAAVLHNMAGPLSVLSGLHGEIRPQLSNQQNRDFQVNVNFLFAVVRHAQRQLRRDPAEKEVIFLQPLLGEIRDLVRAVAVYKGIEVEVGAAPEIWLEGDSVLLRQVLLNLAQNALEALSTATQGKLLFSAVKKSEKIHITVQDNGRGMTKAELALVGKRFYSRDGQGLGLGSSFVRETIQRQFGGVCHYRSAFGVGTTVTLILPVQ